MEIGVRFRLTKPVKSQDLFTFLSNLNQDLKAGPRQETEAKNLHLIQRKNKNPHCRGQCLKYGA